MSVNSINQLASELRELPPESPSADLLDRVRNRIQRRNTIHQQIMRFGAVSGVAIAVIGTVVFNLDYLDRSDPVMSVQQAGLASDSDAQLTPLQRELLQNYSVSTLAQSAIIVQIADIDTQLAELGTDDADRRAELLNQREGLKNDYRLVRNQSKPNTKPIPDGFI